MRFYSVLFTILIISFSSCRNTENELFEIQMEARLDISAGLNSIETHIFVLEDISSTLEANLVQKGMSIDQVNSIKPSTALMDGVFNEIDYSIVEEIAINIVDGTDSSNKIEVFYQELIPLNHSGPLQMFGSLPDIKDILNNDSYDLEVEIRFRTPTVQTMENKIIYNFVAFGE